MSKAEVYGRPSCPWCVKAKELLVSKGVQVEEHHIGVSPKFPTKEVLQERLGKPVNTVPQIVLDGVYIGGYSDLARHYGIQ